MGRSSLRVRTSQRLQAQGITCAHIDLTSFGSRDVTLEQWYAAFVTHLVRAFDLSENFNWQTWWREWEFLSPVQRLSKFIEEVLLESIP